MKDTTDRKDNPKINLENESKKIIEQANYERVFKNDLNDGFNSQLLLKVNLQVDSDDFEEMLFLDVVTVQNGIY